MKTEWLSTWYWGEGVSEKTHEVLHHLTKFLSEKCTGSAGSLNGLANLQPNYLRFVSRLC